MVDNFNATIVTKAYDVSCSTLLNYKLDVKTNSAMMQDCFMKVPICTMQVLMKILRQGNIWVAV